MSRGEYMATFGAMKRNGLELRNAINAENARFMQVHGQVWDSKKDTTAAGDAGGLASLLDTPDDATAGGAPVVRPGDASVAAPFTSRVPSVRAAVDLIRQGRCTLLSALMQQQIMMLESTIAAYTMAALSLHNARSSERQMMASSWLIMTAAISFSYSTPLDKMHPLRPLRSLFHPAIILSVLGQAAIHIFCMSAAVQWATDEMGPVKLKEVTEFFKKAKAKEITMGCAEDDYICQLQSFWEAPFMPNLLNTTVFLVETSQMISVFFANYKGRPWMKGMLDNHALFLSVFICIGGVAVASWEMSPKLNQLLQFAPFPDDAYRYKVIALVCASIIGTFVWDRLCTLVFARPVFKAMTAEVLRTTITDMLPVIKTAAKVKCRRRCQRRISLDRRHRLQL
jgi:cation-transporting ATPase 13A1